MQTAARRQRFRSQAAHLVLLTVPELPSNLHKARSKRNGATSLPVNLAAIADAHDKNHHRLVLEPGNHAIIPDAVFPVAGQRSSQGFAQIAGVVERRDALRQEVQYALALPGRKPGHVLVDLRIEFDGPHGQSYSFSPRPYFSIMASSEIRGPFSSTRC